MSRHASTRTVPYSGVSGSSSDSSGSGLAAAGPLWQVTGVPWVAGRPFLPAR
jgi:hypothetical protein